MADCPTPEELASLVEEELERAERDRLETHLDGCPSCAETFQSIIAETEKEWGSWKGLLKPNDEGLRSSISTLSMEQLRAHFSRLGFEEVEQIGSGGMGVVYKAHQPSLNRDVAIKMLLGGALAGTERQARLVAEARSLARLRHPSIVQIYGVEEFQGVPFLVLEYVDAGTLADKIIKKPLKDEEAARICLEIASAVAHAHEQGIIHRDIKPTNILFSRDGPRLADFGLAKSESEISLTGTGLVGTPAYMAPEQTAHNGTSVTEQTDVYSIGAVLYETLCGIAPFRSSNASETLRRIAEELPVAPSKIQTNIARDLETICLKCLQKQSSDRYASATDLAKDLERFLAGEPIQARRPSILKRAQLWTKRSPMQAALLLLSVVLSAGLLLLWGQFTLELQRERDLTMVQSDFANENFLRAQSAIKNYLDSFRTHTPLGSKENLAFQEETIQTGLEFYEELIRSVSDRQGTTTLRGEALERTKLDYAALLVEFGKVMDISGKPRESYDAYSMAFEVCRDVEASDEENIVREATKLRSAALMSSTSVAKKTIGLAGAIGNAELSLASNEKFGDLGPEGDSYKNWYQAIGFMKLANLQRAAGQVKEARKTLARARVYASYLPGVTDFIMTQGQVFLAQAELERTDNRPQIAATFIAQAIQEFEWLCFDVNPHHVFPRYEALLARSYVERASIHSDLTGGDDAVRSLPYFQEAVLVLQSLVKRYPGVEQFEIELRTLAAERVKRATDQQELRYFQDLLTTLDYVQETATGAEVEPYAEIKGNLYDAERMKRNGEAFQSLEKLDLVRNSIKAIRDADGLGSDFRQLVIRESSMRSKLLFEIGRFEEAAKSIADLSQRIELSDSLQTIALVCRAKLGKQIAPGSLASLQANDLNQNSPWLVFLNFQQSLSSTDSIRAAAQIRLLADEMKVEDSERHSQLPAIRAAIHSVMHYRNRRDASESRESRESQVSALAAEIAVLTKAIERNVQRLKEGHRVWLETDAVVRKFLEASKHVLYADKSGEHAESTGELTETAN